jgi:hypothetical protein
MLYNVKVPFEGESKGRTVYVVEATCEEEALKRFNEGDCQGIYDQLDRDLRNHRINKIKVSLR